MSRKKLHFLRSLQCWFYHFFNRLSWRTWKIAFFHLHHGQQTKVFTLRQTRTQAIFLDRPCWFCQCSHQDGHGHRLLFRILIIKSKKNSILSCFLSVRHEELERLLFFHLHHGLQNDRRQSSRIKKMIRDDVRACVGDDDRGWHPGWVSVLVWIDLNLS